MTLKIRAGYDIAFECFQETPMVLMLSVHPSRQPDLLTEHAIRLSPGIMARDYRDAFDNICTRWSHHPACLKLEATSLSKTAGFPMRSHRTRSNGASMPCPTMP
jgi:hypothetical protein